MDIILQSVPETIEQKTWVAIPVTAPNAIGVLSVDDRQFYAQIIDNVLYSFVALSYGKSGRGTFLEVPNATPKVFTYSEWITDNITALVPEFRAVLTAKADPFAGTIIYDDKTKAQLELVVDNNIRKVFKYTTIINELSLTLECNIEIFTEQDIVNFGILMRVADDIPNTQIKRLYMVMKEEVMCDNAKSKKLESRYLGEGLWATDVLAETLIHSGFKATVTGAVLCRNGKPPSIEDEIRLNNLNSRKEARIVGRVENNG